MQQQAGENFPDEPRDLVWERIRLQLAVESPKQVKRFSLRKAAAIAACFIGLTGFAAWWLYQGDKNPAREKESVAVSGKQPIAAPQQKQADESGEMNAPLAKTETFVPKKAPAKRMPATHPSMPPHTESAAAMQESAFLQNLESSFTQVINLQRDKLNQTPMYAESPEYFRDFKVQFNQMNKDEQTIRKDIVRLGMSQELLDQLINVYQQKLNLLKQLQLEMTKTNNRFQQHASPVDSLNTYFIHL